MRKLILAFALTTAATLGGATAASAFERNFSIETDRGTITGSADVYCFEGACYREGELTGVNGKTLESSGMCVRRGYHRWDCKGTVTGPEGNTATRRFHVRSF
jgi:hypothetical protein